MSEESNDRTNHVGGPIYCGSAVGGVAFGAIMYHSVLSSGASGVLLILLFLLGFLMILASMFGASGGASGWYVSIFDGFGVGLVSSPIIYGALMMMLNAFELTIAIWGIGP